MSTEINAMLNRLYANDEVTSMSKTAEDNLLSALSDERQVSENPYSTMSDGDLLSLLGEVEKVASVGGTPDLLEKTASEMLGGQVMARAMVHEMGLIKEAMSHGICRVCKEAPMDVEQSSICSGCNEASS